MTNFTKAQKAQIRTIVAAHYSERDGRNVRIMQNGEVHVTVDGIRTYCNQHCLFAGYAKDIIAHGFC